MAVIQNENGLVAVQQPTLSGLLYQNIQLYDNTAATYEFLYKTQPELRSTIDFLARNIAQIPLHAYERVSDNERRRISDGPLAETLRQPDIHSTRSRWLECLVKDLAIFDAAYFVKVRGESGRIALVRIPPQTVEILGTNWMRPDGYKVHGSSGVVEFPADAVIGFWGYNPSDPRKGLSPLETLRRILAEQAAAGQYRERMWQQGARVGGLIERPQGAPSWSDAARQRFRAEFEATYTGAAASGKTLVLEEGMTYKPISFTARDAQYLESFQLSREVVAAAYGIPNGLLGLGSNTYASLSEQHRQLYSDCLAPYLVRIEEQLEKDLLVEFDVDPNTYLEFQIAAKMAGSFIEQAQVLQASVGAPYLTRNEARARLNLPPVDGGNDLVTPLNVLVGGQASPQDSVPESRILGALSDEPTGQKSDQPGKKAVSRQRALRERRKAADDLRGEIRRAFERQRRSVEAKLGSKSKSGIKANAADVFDRNRFQKELNEDIRPVIGKTARKMAETVGPWDEENGADYLDTVAENFAEEVTQSTFERLDTALDSDDPTTAVGDLFDSLEDNMAGVFAASLTVSIAEWARAESANANDVATKTWIVTSGNPRSEHAALDGETVPRNEPFSNGAMFPGDPSLPPEDRVNCECIVDWE